MPKLNPATLGEWVTVYPQTARLLDELQIDYCCGGADTLAQACEERGLDLDAVVGRLANAIVDQKADSYLNYDAMSPSELCDQIEQSHHAFLRRELPRLTELIDRVLTAHGERHPELRELQAVFRELRAELEPHMLKEEQILFPAIRQLTQRRAQPQFPFGTVANPIRVMEHEHENAGAGLKKIRALTSDFHAPQDACNTWHVLLDGLRQLESDMHQHVHKENNILFPKAQQLEVSVSSNSVATPRKT